MKSMYMVVWSVVAAITNITINVITDETRLHLSSLNIIISTTQANAIANNKI